MGKCELCGTLHNEVMKEVVQEAQFKGVSFVYKAMFIYCETYDELFETEELLNENNKMMKDAYRKKVGLLPSYEIARIRKEYGLSQKALSKALGWGELTVTRYETYQIQDKIHNDMLKKIDVDPEWFVELLCDSKESLSKKQFEKAFRLANEKIISIQNDKIMDEVRELYANFEIEENIRLDKVRAVINYIAKRIDNLYTVKLMKLMWYVDNFFYQENEDSITGLEYQAFPMGALPIGYLHIIETPGIKYIKEDVKRRFVCCDEKIMEYLSHDEIKVLEEVLEKYGHLSTDDLVETMHNERAYIETEKFSIIDYNYAKDLRK